jgi:hypothetical protein
MTPPSSMATVTLIDGRQVDSASEDWRHECEARHVARLPSRDARRAYIERVTAKRGAQAGQALQALATQIYTTERNGAHA